MMRKDIKIVCAWCHEDMGHNGDRGVQRVSYSICPACLADWYRLRRHSTGAPAYQAHEITLAAIGT